MEIHIIKSILRWLFSEPVRQSNEIELRNAIIGALPEHLNRLGHPVEAVRIPSHAMPNRDDSAFTNTFFGASNLRLIAGLDAFGNNVVTGHTASAASNADTIDWDALYGQALHLARTHSPGSPASAAAEARGDLASANLAANIPVRVSAGFITNATGTAARTDRASANLAATDTAGGPYPRPATLAEAAEYFARKKGAK